MFTNQSEFLWDSLTVEANWIFSEGDVSNYLRICQWFVCNPFKILGRLPEILFQNGRCLTFRQRLSQPRSVYLSNWNRALHPSPFFIVPFSTLSSSSSVSLFHPLFLSFLFVYGRGYERLQLQVSAFSLWWVAAASFIETTISTKVTHHIINLVQCTLHSGWLAPPFFAVLVGHWFTFGGKLQRVVWFFLDASIVFDIPWLSLMKVCVDWDPLFRFFI